MHNFVRYSTINVTVNVECFLRNLSSSYFRLFPSNRVLSKKVQDFNYSTEIIYTQALCKIYLAIFFPRHVDVTINKSTIIVFFLDFLAQQQKVSSERSEGEICVLAFHYLSSFREFVAGSLSSLSRQDKKQKILSLKAQRNSFPGMRSSRTKTYGQSLKEREWTVKRGQRRAKGDTLQKLAYTYEKVSAIDSTVH